jgi:1,4-dihydroxy-6-naphthoate synthase
MPLLSSKLIRVGHSPDPDDAFMFYALAKERIPMRSFQVEHVVEDIESLNQRALRGELEVTAVSCHAYAYLRDRYVILQSGASVGDQYGPILVAPQPNPLAGKKGKKVPGTFLGDRHRLICGKRIAVPGKLTTAYLVLQLFERDFEPVFTPFDQIFDAVLSGQADFGLVIHEGQITYEEKGLCNIIDLGQWWWEETGLPLPLGVDVIRRDLDSETIKTFTSLFKAGIQYALEHREEALEYALQFGRGIRKPLGDQFVGMYVNDYTVDLGTKGKAGLIRLYEEGYRKGILPHPVLPEFV